METNQLSLKRRKNKEVGTVSRGSTETWKQIISDTEIASDNRK
jgi:hypothetical protein